MPTKRPLPIPREKDPLWYKHAVIYQLHVRAFKDSDGNGVGDFKGLTEQLDYLQDLGVTAVWLLPFYPSPLKDDGYDIADYYTINPIYGTLNDMKAFLRQARRRGLRVITELVINHTSDQHPWFQRSRRAPAGSRWRNFYVWNDQPDKYRDARVIFKDFEHSNWTWDPVAGAYYWHRFYSHQPDLNFDNPEVHREILKALDFWLDMGVDGLRLDAIPYLYEREGTTCENLPETHAFLRTLRARVDQRYGDRMLLAEANQWPEDAVAYFGRNPGDECHMAFHFPLMPRLFMAVRMEDRVPIVDILDQTPAIPETSQWAIFLRNHDELTLEMVTDEERDYMYRVYATDPKARLNLGIRRRLAPLLGNDRKRIELLNALLFSFPGTPVIYYGDEIGMGDNVFLGDRNGVRTPMQWSSDRNAGFSKANPQGLYLPIILDPEYHYEAFNVEAQQRNPHSLYWWMKRLIALRKRFHAFGRGSIRFLQPDNRKILAFVREHESERILVVANLSRFVQPFELNLQEYQQMVPTELFGRAEFPPITDRPYFLTLSPHAFYWFSLDPRYPEATLQTRGAKPAIERAALTLSSQWEEALEERHRSSLESCLADYIRPRRWFGGKTREIKATPIREIIPVAWPGGTAALLFVQVDYYEGDPELYQVPMTFLSGSAAEALGRDYPHLIIAPVQLSRLAEGGVLCDALVHPEFGRALLDGMARRRLWRGEQGTLHAQGMPPLRQVRSDASAPPDPSLSKAEQSNSALIYGQQWILKLFRKLDTGLNPDLEVNRFLTRKEFPHVPALAGYLEYRQKDHGTMSLGMLSAWVPEAKDAWAHTLDTLSRVYERVGSLEETQRDIQPPTGSFLEIQRNEAPEAIRAVLGTYLETARLLGDRTGAMHLCLASDPAEKDFAPEPFTPHSQRSLYQSMRNLAKQNLQLLRRRLKSLPESAQADATLVASKELAILDRLQAVTRRRISAMRIRTHGDYHLGQVLHTGKDFVIIDFEGEPARAMGERRIKRSPLRDVAGMIRSFHYAAYTALARHAERGNLNHEGLTRVEPWARTWYRRVSAAFFHGYLTACQSAPFMPKTEEEITVLLDAELIDKALYELGYELQHRPEWIPIPLRGILELVG